MSVLTKLSGQVKNPASIKYLFKLTIVKSFTSNTGIIHLTGHQRQPKFLAIMKIKFEKLSTKLLVLKSDRYIILRRIKLAEEANDTRANFSFVL